MRLALLIAALVVAASPAHADFEAGAAAHDRGDHATALKEWQPLAERGDARAEHGIGTLYLNGQGVRADPRAAAEWFRRAADRGYSEAEFSLGQMFSAGNGVRRDLRAAAEWFLKAALKKHSSAQFALARMYELGQGVEQDDVKALAWYRLSVESGNPFAVERGVRLELEMSPTAIEAADAFAKDVFVKGAKL